MQPNPSDYRPSPEALSGRVVIVTGAGSGIGRAVAEAAAGHGATVILLGRRTKPLEAAFDAIVESGGPEPAILPLDLSKATPENFRELAEKIESEFGRLDGVVHNAAHFDALKPLDDVSAKEWYQTLQVNLSGPYLMTQCLLPLLRASDHGRIVFTLDDPDTVTRAYWGAYGVSKLGAEALMKILADEVESAGLRVCGIRPGPTATGLRAKAWAAEDASELTRPEGRARGFVYALDPASEPVAGSVIEA